MVSEDPSSRQGLQYRLKYRHEASTPVVCYSVEPWLEYKGTKSQASAKFPGTNRRRCVTRTLGVLDAHMVVDACACVHVAHAGSVWKRSRWPARAQARLCPMRLSVMSLCMDEQAGDAMTHGYRRAIIFDDFNSVLVRLASRSRQQKD